jgi:8-oxo-dGTP diphosphatase
MQQYVLGFLFDDDENVVLVRKNKPAWQCGLLNGVGGKIEPNETELKAMVREFTEETGVDTSALPWRKFCIMKGIDFIVHCFTVTDTTAWDNASTQESEEIEKTDLVGLWIGNDHISNLRWLIEMALDKNMGNSFTAIIRYDDMVKEKSLLEKVCIHPTSTEIIEVIHQIDNWNLYRADFIVGEIMKYYRGKCNPTVIREVVEKYTDGIR